MRPQAEFLRVLSDANLLDVMGRLDAVSLARFGAVNLRLYTLSHTAGLWRDLTLKDKCGNFRFCGSWRETYTGHGHAQLDRSLASVRPATFLDVEPRWLERSNIERRSVDELSIEEFIETYEKPGVPVILTGAVPSWPAATEWTQNRLLERFPEQLFRVSATVDMRLKDYFAYCNNCKGDERALYLFDKDFCTKCPEMASEFTIPKYFQQDLMGVLGEHRRPDYKWLIIGPALSGSSFHVDPNCNFAWNATIQGRKKWVMYPPGVPPPLSSEQDRQVSLLQWFHEQYDDDDNVDVRLECVTEGGECMYVPRGWWHCVLNLDLCIAITHNVVTTQNLLPAIRFLERCEPCAPGQGCRGVTKINFSGDVPTSVIFPYKNHVEQAAKADALFHMSATCECSAKQLQLLHDFKEALERSMPGALERILADHAAKQAAAASPWTKLGLMPGETTEAAPFSFNFAIDAEAADEGEEDRT
jgi:hypothetical protein